MKLPAMNFNASRSRLADGVRFTTLIVGTALTATNVLSTPVNLGDISTNAAERLTLCALLALPSFLPFLFPEIYRALSRACDRAETTQAAIAILGFSLALVFLPAIARELIAISTWPVFAIAFAKSVHIDKPDSETGVKTMFGPIGAVGIYFLLMLGVTLPETQVVCGAPSERLMQGSTSLCLLIMAYIPLACLYWNKGGAVKGGLFLCATSIALLLVRGYASKTAFNISLLLVVTAIILLFKTITENWTIDAGQHSEASKRIFYVLCAMPSFTAIAHMFLSVFLTGKDATAADQGGLLLALVMAITPCCSAFFLWLSGRKPAHRQTAKLPGTDSDESEPGRPLQDIEDALDTGALTPQELKVAARLSAGMSLATIAEDIGVTKSTVGTYAKRIYTKLGVQTQAEALLALKATADDGAIVKAKKDDADSLSEQTAKTGIPCKALSHICSAVLVLLVFMLQKLLEELLDESGRSAGIVDGSFSVSPLALLTCLACILAVLTVFSLYRTRRPLAPELCCTALLALTYVFSGFLAGNDESDAASLYLYSFLHTVSACCCAVCILAVAQRCANPSRKEISVLALLAVCALALRQIPGIAGVLDLLALIGSALVIFLEPLEWRETSFPFSMAPPLKSLVAMPFIGFSVYTAAYAGDVIAQQYQPAAVVLLLASLAVLLVAAGQITRLAAALGEPIYPLATLCIAASFPGLAFGSACAIGHPIDTAPILLLAGVAVTAGYVPLAHRDAQLLLQRKELATETDDEFLQKALIDHKLTGSEAHVASLAAKGLSVSEVAKELTVSLNTVKTHLRHAYRKLNVNDKGELTSTVTGIYRQSVNRLAAVENTPDRN